MPTRKAIARGGPGPTYDATLRWLVANDPGAICRLLGEGTSEPPELLSESLPVNAVFVDALLRVGTDRLMHTEFVRRVEPDLAARMLEYRARIMRRYPGLTLVQHVLLLADGVLASRFGDSEHGFRLHVTYLREVLVEAVLAQPSLAPLAVLAAAPDEVARVRHFQESLRVIRRTEPHRARAEELAGAAGVLAVLRLGSRTIRWTWREMLMDAITREDVERFWEALQPANEQERLEDLAYEKALPVARFIDEVLERKFGGDLRSGRLALALAQNYEPKEALDLIEAADSFEALQAKL